MVLGRFIFGVGAESLSVAQSRIATRWFKGRELAFALVTTPRRVALGFAVHL